MYIPINLRKYCRIEEIATSISTTSAKIYTLNNINNVIIELCDREYQGAKVAEREVNKILEKNKEEKDELYKRCRYFFGALIENEFVNKAVDIHRNLVRTKKLYNKGTEGRKCNFTWGGITIVVAAAYKFFEKNKEKDYNYELQKIMNYDWSRKNKDFHKVGLISSDNSIITNGKAIIEAKK